MNSNYLLLKFWNITKQHANTGSVIPFVLNIQKNVIRHFLEDSLTYPKISVLFFYLTRYLTDVVHDRIFTIR